MIKCSKVALKHYYGNEVIMYTIRNSEGLLNMVHALLNITETNSVAKKFQNPKEMERQSF
jgi:hypothetical protein